MTAVGPHLPWSLAWSDAAKDFWSRELPTSHFVTSVSPLLAERIAEIARQTHSRLGHPDEFWVVDIGCGEGQLLEMVRERCHDLAPHMRWMGIDVRRVSLRGVESIQAACPAEVEGAPFVGLVMAHEWLDEIPCDVIERDEAGIDRVVLVDQHGHESLGPAITDDAACAVVGVDAQSAREWMEAWWPLLEPGDRAEVGLARDRAWAWMGTLVKAGCALATDYGHERRERRDAHRYGTLTGYLDGRVVPPVPHGHVAITAHVALDSCAAALPGTRRSRQRDEITALSVPGEPDVADIDAFFEGLRLRSSSRLGNVGWLRWER